MDHHTYTTIRCPYLASMIRNVARTPTLSKEWECVDHDSENRLFHALNTLGEMIASNKSPDKTFTELGFLRARLDKNDMIFKVEGRRWEGGIGFSQLPFPLQFTVAWSPHRRLPDVFDQGTNSTNLLRRVRVETPTIRSSK